MSNEFSNKPTMEYLEDNMSNSEWADYVKENYFTILDNFNKGQLPDACDILAHTLNNQIVGKEQSDSDYLINKAISDICRIGINSYQEGKDRKEVQINNLANADRIGDLLLGLAISMRNSNRPIAAFGYLDAAENSYLRMIDLIKDKDNDYVKRLQASYEQCRAKEAELYIDLIPYIQETHRPMFSTVAQSYATHSIVNLKRYGDYQLMDEYENNLKKALLYCVKYPMSSQKEIDDMNRKSIKDPYIDWCQNHVRFLNLFNEVPHNNIKYACDDIKLDLDEKHQWLLDDIIKTYDHCRKIFYRTAKNVDEFIKKSRDDDIECVIDCFVRLYTLLDKSSKIIIHLFPRDQNVRAQYFYDVAESFSNSPNPFLRSIYRVAMDIFPDREAKTDNTFDPRNNVYGMVMMRGFVRNSIMHGTLRIFKEDETKDNYYNVLSITPLELLQCTEMMFQDVREIILNIQLAVGYRKVN